LYFSTNKATINNVKHGDAIRFLILRTIGNFLVLFAIFGILATFGPALYYEVAYKVVLARGVHYVVSQNVQLPKVQSQIQPSSGGTASFADVLAGPKEQILTPKDTNFSILIPKIGASAKVFPNVDPSNQAQFLPVLMQGVAHAAGTVFPGMKGNVYLFAHSTDNFWDVGRYNAVFYLLKDLNKGDDVVIFYQNKRYNYIVTGSKIVGPSDVSYLVNSQNQNKQQLVLQTCWPPGTTLQRLLVFAQPK
jgi:LPXTG-site transpeptidase (sortase) family protein